VDARARRGDRETRAHNTVEETSGMLHSAAHRLYVRHARFVRSRTKLDRGITVEPCAGRKRPGHIQIRLFKQGCSVS